jgi:hypothetical protein
MDPPEHGGEYQCPLAAVDQRLEDAHQLWHQAEQNYFDPNSFRLVVQNTIQTLRSVTFILQKHKNVIPNFDEWYAPWQSRLKEDPLMRWLVDARNKIEKEGDLISHSFIRAEIIASYLDEGPTLEIKAELFQGIDDLVKTIPEEVFRKHVSKHGGIRIQRRWIENNLPEYELLDALAIAFGRLAEIVHDCHRQMGLPTPRIPYEDKLGSFDLKDNDWLMPCMTFHHDPRSLLISFEDGATLAFDKIAKTIDKEAASKAVERYGADALSEIPRNPDSLMDIVQGFFQVARTMFLKDGYHGSITILLREKRPVRIVQTQASDQFEKYLLMRELAHEVVLTGADALFTINEAWMTAVDDLGPYERPSEASNRKEALVLVLASRSGPPIQLCAIIERNGELTTLGATEVIETGAAFAFAPIYEAWKKPIPPEWMQMVAQYEAAVRKNRPL